jgi:hypothetical protein
LGIFLRLVRENIEFRANEREKDCSARKFTRLDPDIKLKERDKKRLVRENIEFRANEREKECSATLQFLFFKITFMLYIFCGFSFVSLYCFIVLLISDWVVLS